MKTWQVKPYQHKIFLFLLVFYSAVIGFNSNVSAIPYFDSVSFYTENNQSWGSWIYQFGAQVFDDDYSIASVSVIGFQNGNLVYADDLSTTVTLTGSWHWGSAGVGVPSFMNRMFISATNTNNETNSVWTHFLTEEQLPFATGVTISDNSLTPTFNWNSVPGAEDYRVRIQDQNGDRIFDSSLHHPDITETFYTLPGGVLSGGESYYLRLIANDRDWNGIVPADLDADQWIGELENRSSTYLAFRTTPIPEPATMLLLGTGLIGLAGMRRRSNK